MWWIAKRKTLQAILAPCSIDKADKGFLDIVESFFILTKRACETHVAEWGLSANNIPLANPTFVSYNRIVRNVETVSNNHKEQRARAAHERSQ